MTPASCFLLARLARHRARRALAWAMTMLLLLSTPVVLAKPATAPAEKTAPCEMASMPSSHHAMPMGAMHRDTGGCACCDHADCGCSVATSASLFAVSLGRIAWFSPDRDGVVAAVTAWHAAATAPPLRPPIA